MWPFTLKRPTPVAVSIQQRSEIMGRIHASNVASLADMHISLRSGEDYKKALERINYKLNHQALRTAM